MYIKLYHMNWNIFSLSTYTTVSSSVNWTIFNSWTHRINTGWLVHEGEKWSGVSTTDDEREDPCDYWEDSYVTRLRLPRQSSRLNDRNSFVSDIVEAMRTICAIWWNDQRLFERSSDPRFSFTVEKWRTILILLDTISNV